MQISSYTKPTNTATQQQGAPGRGRTDACIYCGQGGFRWADTDYGRRLTNPVTGEVHQCDEYWKKRPGPVTTKQQAPASGTIGPPAPANDDQLERQIEATKALALAVEKLVVTLDSFHAEKKKAQVPDWKPPLPVTVRRE